MVEVVVVVVVVVVAAVVVVEQPVGLPSPWPWLVQSFPPPLSRPGSAFDASAGIARTINALATRAHKTDRARRINLRNVSEEMVISRVDRPCIMCIAPATPTWDRIPPASADSDKSNKFRQPVHF